LIKEEYCLSECIRIFYHGRPEAGSSSVGRKLIEPGAVPRWGGSSPTFKPDQTLSMTSIQVHPPPPGVCLLPFSSPATRDGKKKDPGNEVVSRLD